MDLTDVNIQEKSVLLLKASREESEDPYVEVLKEAGFNPHVIPTLDFRFVNGPLLATHLQNSRAFSAIIFTSTRAVQAVQQALATVKDQEEVYQEISNLTCYTVGQATAAAVKSLGLSSLGEDAGNAASLLQIIFQKISKSSKPVLYPCANIRKDTIIDGFKEKGVELIEVVAYETYPNNNLEQHIRETILSQGHPEFVVFFSPSGVQYVDNCNVCKILLPTKIIALGPSTKAEIENHGYHVYGVPQSPNPESLLHLLNQE